MVIKKGKLKRGLALLLATITMSSSVIPYLPPNLLTAYAFHINFRQSGQAGHPDIYGDIGDGNGTQGLFCLNKGASAHSNYNYSKINADVNYSTGTLQQKRMFWAYILTHGSADISNDSLERRFGTPLRGNTAAGKEVAWSNGNSLPRDKKAADLIENYANDGFAQLAELPEGAKSAKDILSTVMTYNTPETAIGLSQLQAGPGEISPEKLWNLAGLSSMEYFNKYCKLSADPVSFQGKTFNVVFDTSGSTISYKLVDENGWAPIAGTGEKWPNIIMKVTYDPAYFKVISVNGKLEYFKCDEYGSQQLYRAMGNYTEQNPVFYITTGAGVSPSIPGGSQGSGGGSLDEGQEINVKIYKHEETFESNYKVDLTKKDYETGNELKDATWQVLEAFPDQTTLADNEEGGNLVEKNMREDPTTWPDWLIFEDDMKTDENGYISHADTRYYDFGHTYCNGHPEPEKPESSGDPEADADAEAEYEALMEEWQAAVDECESQAQASGGTHHHWVVGGTEEPTEEESFEGSGAKAARDAAYQNFINLRYSYTFREVDARDGYIIHGQNGHPDDVPIEIITTAASEAEKEYEWTQASNEDIVVTGYSRDYISDSSEEGGDEGGDTEGAALEVNSLSGKKMKLRSNVATDSQIGNDEESKNIYLTEKYDLTFGQKAVNALRQFIGLPEKYVTKNDFMLNIVAEYDEVNEATPSDAEEADAEDEEIVEEDVELVNDLGTADSNKEDKTDKTATKNSAKTRAKKTAKKVSKVATGSNAESNDEEEEEIGSDIASDSEVSDYSFSDAGLMTMAADEDVEAAAEGEGSSKIDLENATVDSQPPVEPGPADRILHSWIVYDHRVPGQIHINKRDMELKAGETEEYDSYGDTQGDSTLEGAVYGLFAADDIYHPDTQRNDDGTVKKGSGVVFDANDLVAIATTDKNGDASFLTITEKPHSTYNYKTGQIEYSGKEYPKNLYDMDGYRKEYDEEETGRIYKNTLQTNGDYWIGRPLILGNYYIKELDRSEGFELSITGKDMTLTNATDENRENYGETDDSKSHPEGTAWISDKLTHAVTFPEANETYGNRENLLEVGVKSNNATNGYDVVFDGIPHVDGVDFYFNDVKTNKVTVQVPVGGEWVDATEEPLYETAADSTTVKRDKDGNPILNPNAIKDFPVSYTGYGYQVKKVTGTSAAPNNAAKYGQTFTDSDANFNYVKYELESMLRDIGVNTPKDYDSGSYSQIDFPVYDEKVPDGNGMPEYTIQISNVTTNKSVIDSLLNYFVQNQVYTYGSLQKLVKSGNTVTATVALGMSPKKTTLYDTDAAGNITAAYLFKLNEDAGRYVMRKYTGDAIIAETIPGSKDKVKLTLRPDFIINKETGLPENNLTYRPGTEYLTYQTGETIYDYFEQNAAGEWVGHAPVHRKVYQVKYEEQEQEQDATTTSKVTVVKSREEVTDPIGSTYVYYDEELKQYILHAGTKDVDLSGQKEASFTVALPDGKTTLTDADIAKIGDNNVWGYKVGDSLNNSAYLIRIQGAGAGVHTALDFDKDTSFIKNQRLIYNGNHDLTEDGNTNENPNGVLERIIGQQIKVTKTIEETSYNNTNSYGDIHDDWFTQTFGGLLGQNKEALKMDNFRFKVYLKSNITRLYRDNDGNVVWQDRKGAEVDQLKVNELFPARVNKIYTKVLHQTDLLFKDSEDAIVANDSLYSYTDGLINENQNEGYTSVLETVDRTVESNDTTRTVSGYNYDKFFDAIQVANNDKWDDANPTYTSWMPIGNAANRNGNTIENAKVSDKVRQFAIDWYLDDEIKKLVKDVPNGAGEKEDADGNVGYSDELYDDALRAAIIKAENYLKPFFAYDLDRIYSIEWDSAENGGSDKDTTTLSADTLYGDKDNTSEGYYFGTSVMLPYGTYVVAEQQPKYDNLNDFANKHYQIDKPREVILPSVYASYEGSQQSPEVLNDYYNYDAAITQPDMERKYKIRFNEEPVHVIKGRNAEGDFEVYKYGMDIQNIRNGVTGTAAGDYFALTQDAYKPYKNYYNPQDDRTTGDVPYYLTEGLSGREKVSKYYRYSSVSEDAATADNVQFPNGTATEDNVPGFHYEDNVKTMKGVQTAYNGLYASMLVPWTVVPSDNAETEKTDVALKGNGESSYKGFDYTKFRNRFFTTKLRIEKLDSETHENILHDGAIFNIYAAKRDDSKNGQGQVLFYEEDTRIGGTKEFLEAMGATDIKPEKRRAASWIDRLTGKEYGAGNLYTGIVPAGTPICEESEQIYLGDSKGERTAAFKSYSTVLDGLMKAEQTNADPKSYMQQTVGYLETPQPLGAGAYVIAEAKSPVGYSRSKPIALEVYSDKVTYYKEGNKDKRVLAAIYEYPSDNQTTNGNKPQDIINVAQVDVENYPIKLTVEKVKESSNQTANTTADKTVTYRVSGRVDGKLAEIGNNKDLDYAYDDNGNYLGYAWKKGTLEYLLERKAAGENIEIVYDGKYFAGYGYVKRTLETADDKNGYVAGATMTLFDALEIAQYGDTEDKAFEGLVIERDKNNNISRMYVKQGYAGNKVEFVREKDENGNDYVVDYPAGVDKNGQPVTANGNIWKAETIERPDTDILYYDLDSLDIFKTVNADNKKIKYGYDKNHDMVSLDMVESDKANYDKTDSEHSIYAFKGGQPYLEFVGGDFKEIEYSANDKVLTVGNGTHVYHLDRDGNRDALVDPYTGMAYVVEGFDGTNGSWDQLAGGVHGDDRIKVLVWAINIRRDSYGNVISRDKITTSRLATIGENLDGYNEDVTLDVTNNSGKDIPAADRPSYQHSESGYITGSWKSENGEESHKETTVNVNGAGHNMNEDVLVDDNNGSFEKKLNPTYDEHGLVNYYQRSDETYDKGSDLYDRNDDFVRYQDSDNLEEYNNAAYRINEHDELYDGSESKEGQKQKELWHRQGEGYVLENTWVTSDKTPNDPFDTNPQDGQADILKRVPAGHYIMEELQVPEGTGYLKGMPTGISVMETAEMQHAKMVDKTTKIELSKIDGTEKHVFDLVNMETGKVEGTVQESTGSYGNGPVEGAVIALYKAKKVYTSDFITYPKGYYLVKADENEGPAKYYSTDSMLSEIKELTAQWTTGTVPIYAENLPAGYYLLYELTAPDGFATADPMEVYISNTAEVQPFVFHDDHTKVEIAKHELTDGGKEILNGAGFTLYEGNADGSYDESKVVASWTSDDATDYTDVINLKDYPNTDGKNIESGFMASFEKMYKEFGTTEGTSISWAVERTAKKSSADNNVWVLEDRKKVQVVNGQITFPEGMTQEDKDGFTAAFNAKKNGADVIRWAVNKTAHYVSHTQIDYENANGTASTTKFPTVANIIYETSDGNQVLVSVYGGTANAAGSDYTFEYKFNYKALTAINKYANMYLTADGHVRFDYLPKDKTYVLVETTVPDGYAKADDRVITVKDMTDVQYYSIINETSAIRISKVSEAGTGELAGAKLGLFKAAADGSFVQTDENLVASWTSGEDGTYTDADFVNGLIPDGYKKGDLKPHTISGLPDGIYWLAELTAPGFHTAFEPIEIRYTGSEEIKLVRATDKLVEGKLTIKKTDEGGAPLKGVTFELTAYDGSGKEVLRREISDNNGSIVVTGLPVGAMNDKGEFVPYTYKLKELTPPDGFAVSSEIKTFQFSPDKNGVSYDFGEFAETNVTVVDEKTKIYIEKRDFTHLEGDDGIDGAFVKGAVLAVYEVKGRDDKDDFIYDENAPVAKWTTQANEKHLIEGLIAGRTYLLKELKAPAGYNIMKPVAFTVSANGRGIQQVTNKLNTVTVNYITPENEHLDTDNLDIDSIHSLTLTGRYVSKIETVVTDAKGEEAASWTSNGQMHVLTADDGLKDGTVYTFTEWTVYSDGTRTATDKTTRRVAFDENGEYIVKDRLADYTELAIYYTDGTEIARFTPNEFVADKTIANNVSPENPKVTMKNRNSENGDALNAKDAVINTVAYANTANSKMDVTITATVDDNMEILDTGGGKISGNTITWTVKDVLPLKSGYVTFDSQIKDKKALSAAVEANITFNGKEYSTRKSVPLMQPNKLTIYNELTGSGKDLYQSETSQFKVTLKSEAGTELQGIYAYEGSKEGELRSGDIITLAGNEFITIDPGNIYKNIRYSVERVEDGTAKEFTERNKEGVASEETGAFAVFTRTVRDTSERETFKKGESYILIETTAYSDGKVEESNKFQFTLNDKASIDSVGGYDKETHVTLSKTDITTGEELPGAHIVIKDKDGNTIEEWTSTNEPHEIIGKLTPGEEYTMIETASPDGFAYAEEIKFTVNEDGTVDKVVMEDKKTHVEFSKTDITTGEELPGAYIEIHDKNGNVVESWTTTDKPHVIIGKLIAGETYTMHEKGAANGFAYAADITFTVSLDGRIDKVKMEDKPTHVEISKTDITTGKELPGAHIIIKDKNGNVVDEWTSTNEPHVITGKLNAGEEYTMIEVGAPDGYGYAEDIKFTVSEDGTIDKVVMEDKPTHVTLTKTDITTGEELPGAHIVIKDKNGNIVDEWTSTNEPHEIIGKLVAGEEYTMIETGAPDGYGYAEDIKFTVNKDGSITSVVMEDKPTEVKISKVDITTEKELPGAKLQIVDKSGNIVEEWISTEEAHVITKKLIAGQEYTLIEITAPNGYQLAENIKFTVNRDGSVTSVVMKDKRKPSSGGGGGGGGGHGYETYQPSKYPVTITKRNTDSQIVPGAEYGIYTTGGSLISSMTTGSDGKITFWVTSGDYYIQEISSPTGYSLNKTQYPVTVKEGGTVEGTVDMVDDFAVIAISKLDVSTHEPLTGAVFTLYDENGNEVAKATSGAEGYAEFRKVLYGEYYIMETGAPAGYTLSPEKRYVSITKFYTNAEPIIWYDHPDVPEIKRRPRPKTGDETPIVPVAILLLIAASGYGYLTYRKKREEKGEK